MRIYLAGPLFTTAEVNFNATLARELRANGHEVFLPQEFEQDHTGFDPKAIFLHDLGGLQWCQLVLANMDGPDQDSGTCWELGYGYATNKYTMLYRTDLRRGKEAVNLMMEESANASISFQCGTSADHIASRIDMEIRQRFERSPTHRADQYGNFDRMTKDTTFSAEVKRLCDEFRAAVIDPGAPEERPQRTEHPRHSDK